MDWVLEQNKLTTDKLTESENFQVLFDKYKTVFSDKEKIAYPNVQGDFVYNFWQDEEHVRGIWRRTSKAEYDRNEAKWDIILDLDALSEKEDKKWVFQGADFLRPKNEVCLLYLSDGGTDENVIREFNVSKKSFVDGGFSLPSSKGSASWLGKDSLIISRDFGKGTLTTSGYPRITKILKRGQSIEDAKIIFEAPDTIMGAWGFSRFVNDRYQYYGVSEYATFYDHKQHMYAESGELKTLPLPHDCEINGYTKWSYLITLNSDWKLGVLEFKAGSLISIPFLALLEEGVVNPSLIYEPNERSSISGVAICKDMVVINTMENVQSKLVIARFEGETWKTTSFDAPAYGSISIVDFSPFMKGFYFTYSNFITPPTLFYSDGKTTQEIRKQKERFNVDGIVVNYKEVASKDGTKIPYFIVHKKDIELDGTNPTLVYAYGGFGISQRPSYKTRPGVGWIEDGNVYVIACLRGGGEFGPQWHQAAMKEKRQNAYDDFYAVCEDLIETKITTPKHMGAFGWSNGGLMAGVVATQRPDLFNAVISGAPLLDMKRFSHMLAGASWMGEYGNPDTDDWEYIKKYSPYHNVHKDKQYPEIMFVTSSKDDRVHPAHARKMAALMIEQGHPIFYYETVEGGHGAASTIEQIAFKEALMFTYLKYKLE